MTLHAKLSASGSKRWMNCPGSVRLEKQFPDNNNEYAAYGSAAHSLAEICLKNNQNADSHLGSVLTYPYKPPSADIKVDEEMVEGVQEYLDYVRNLKGESFFEKRVDFSNWVPEGFGTADFGALEQNTLTLVDLKFGKGVQVFAENNTQGILYALGAYNEYDFLYDIKTIRIVIVQPRLDHIDEWDISLDELLEWGDILKQKALEALADDPPLVPGEEQCKFCRAKSTCRALANHNVALAAEDFTKIGPLDSIDNPITVTDPLKLSPEEIGFLLTQTKLFSDWISALEGHALSEMLAGRDIPGFKLVEGRSLRIWKNEKEAIKELKRLQLKKADLFTEKFISPAQAEKVFKQKKLDATALKPLVVKPIGKKTFAPEDDNRPTVRSDAITDFEKVA